MSLPSRACILIPIEIAVTTTTAINPAINASHRILLSSFMSPSYRLIVLPTSEWVFAQSGKASRILESNILSSVTKRSVGALSGLRDKRRVLSGNCRYLPTQRRTRQYPEPRASPPSRGSCSQRVGWWEGSIVPKWRDQKVTVLQFRRGGEGDSVEGEKETKHRRPPPRSFKTSQPPTALRLNAPQPRFLRSNV